MAADWDTYGYDPANYTEPGKSVEGGPKAGLIKMPDGTFRSPADLKPNR